MPTRRALAAAWHRAFLRRIAVALSSGLIVACVPISHTYYKPIGPGTYERSGSGCGGPETRLAIRLADGLDLTVDTWFLPATEAWRPADQMDNVDLTFAVSGGHVLKFLSSEFLVITSTRTLSHRDPKLSASSEMVGFTMAPVRAWPYSVRIPVAERDQRDFLIRFPRVELDGRALTVPDILVEYGTWTHVGALMC